MHCLDRFFECTIPWFDRFQYKENFFFLDNFSIPTINRLHPWDDIRTGGQFCIYHFFANPYCLFPIARCNQDNKDLA